MANKVTIGAMLVAGALLSNTDRLIDVATADRVEITTEKIMPIVNKDSTAVTFGSPRTVNNVNKRGDGIVAPGDSIWYELGHYDKRRDSTYLTRFAYIADSSAYNWDDPVMYFGSFDILPGSNRREIPVAALGFPGEKFDTLVVVNEKDETKGTEIISKVYDRFSEKQPEVISEKAVDLKDGVKDIGDIEAIGGK
jgi:hypothetical protein